MPHLVDDWAAFEDYAEGCRNGYYQELTGLDGIEFRVIAGRLAFKGIFSEVKDALLERARDFCKARGFIKIIKSVNEERFFNPTVAV